MSKNLVIVESPAKATTIGKFLGNDFSVKSSFGHIRDLPSKGLSVDIKQGFKPTYEISPDKTKVVSELKRAAKSKTVWLASDEDREGEAIAWHLINALDLPKDTKRIVFHEITKDAIEHAVANPRTIDIKLVDAQQARRILDRLVGYELSPVLWKKVKTGLSAGRVQSVAVRLVMEREREIRAHEHDFDFKVTGVFKAKTHNMPAELNKRPKTDKAAKEFLQSAAKAKFTVADVSTKPATRNPSPPFTTSTLQQAASSRLGYSVRQTMRLAQELYEHGHITYMRTDSTHLSDTAVKAITDFVKKTYGDKYLVNRQFKTTSKGAQEAHEAIRPTHINKDKAGSSPQAQKLYKLIWQRAVASQMAPAQIKRTEVTIDISTRPEKFIAKGEILSFDGFLKVYPNAQKDIILPKLEPGEKLQHKSITATQTFAKAPARYSEATLVKKLEELGIGRPSTYAPTISTIEDRGYVEKRDVEGESREISVLMLTGGKISEKKEEDIFGGERGRLVPTYLAEQVTDFLVKHFSEVMDYGFTADVEKQFDDIAEGKIKWQAMLEKFYKSFHPLIDKAEDASREEASQARTLGKDPKSGKPVIARFGRYGPMLQIGEATDKKGNEAEEKPKFAPMPDGRSIHDVTLKEALVMFQLPRMVGKTTEGEEIIANIGRFGPYVQVGKTFVSIKEPLDPFTIKEAEALKLYKEKLDKEKKRVIHDFGALQVLNGMYGPYITNGKKNAKVPKETDPKKLTEKQAQKILDEAPDKKNRFSKKPPVIS